MEIRDLRFFCLTAEMEHVTKAAENLGVAQPFLTKIIGQLEKEIGIPLFDNVGRRIKLNKYGEVFYSHAKKILVELDNMRDDMERIIERQSRTIRLLTNTESLYPKMFLEYQKSNPETVLSMSYSARENMVNALRTGNSDFAICSPPISEDVTRGIKTELVFKEHACAMLPPGHPMLSKKAVTFADMDGTDLVTTTHDSALRMNLEPILEKYGYRPNIVCETNDFHLIIEYVLSGLGYAIIPRSLYFSVPSIRQYCVASAYGDTLGEIGISYSTVKSGSCAYSDFIPFVKGYIKRNIKLYFSDLNSIH